MARHHFESLRARFKILDENTERQRMKQVKDTAKVIRSFQSRPEDMRAYMVSVGHPVKRSDNSIEHARQQFQRSNENRRSTSSNGKMEKDMKALREFGRVIQIDPDVLQGRPSVDSLQRLAHQLKSQENIKKMKDMGIEPYAGLVPTDQEIKAAKKKRVEALRAEVKANRLLMKKYKAKISQLTGGKHVLAPPPAPSVSSRTEASGTLKGSEGSIASHDSEFGFGEGEFGGGDESAPPDMEPVQDVLTDSAGKLPLKPGTKVDVYIDKGQHLGETKEGIVKSGVIVRFSDGKKKLQAEKAGAQKTRASFNMHAPKRSEGLEALYELRRVLRIDPVVLKSLARYADDDEKARVLAQRLRVHKAEFKGRYPTRAEIEAARQKMGSMMEEVRGTYVVRFNDNEIKSNVSRHFINVRKVKDPELAKIDSGSAQKMTAEDIKAKAALASLHNYRIALHMDKALCRNLRRHELAEQVRRLSKALKSAKCQEKLEKLGLQVFAGEVPTQEETHALTIAMAKEAKGKEMFHALNEYRIAIHVDRSVLLEAGGEDDSYGERARLLAQKLRSGDCLAKINALGLKAFEGDAPTAAEILEAKKKAHPAIVKEHTDRRMLLARKRRTKVDEQLQKESEDIANEKRRVKRSEKMFRKRVMKRGQVQSDVQNLRAFIRIVGFEPKIYAGFGKLKTDEERRSFLVKRLLSEKAQKFMEKMNIKSPENDVPTKAEIEGAKKIILPEKKKIMVERRRKWQHKQSVQMRKEEEKKAAYSSRRSKGKKTKSMVAKKPALSLNETYDKKARSLQAKKISTIAEYKRTKITREKRLQEYSKEIAATQHLFDGKDKSSILKIPDALREAGKQYETSRDACISAGAAAVSALELSLEFWKGEKQNAHTARTNAKAALDKAKKFENEAENSLSPPLKLYKSCRVSLRRLMKAIEDLTDDDVKESKCKQLECATAEAEKAGKMLQSAAGNIEALRQRLVALSKGETGREGANNEAEHSGPDSEDGPGPDSEMGGDAMDMMNDDETEDDNGEAEADEVQGDEGDDDNDVDGEVDHDGDEDGEDDDDGEGAIDTTLEEGEDIAEQDGENPEEQSEAEETSSVGDLLTALDSARELLKNEDLQDAAEDVEAFLSAVAMHRESSQKKVYDNQSHHATATRAIEKLEGETMSIREFVVRDITPTYEGKKEVEAILQSATNLYNFVKAHNKKAKAAVGKKKKLGEASRQATVQKHVLLLEKVFKILDADGDGNISRSEFADGLGQDELPEDIMSLLNQSAALKHLIDCDPGILKFENVDKDADGQISEEELREWLSEFVEVTNKKDEKHDLEEALQVMQDSANGALTVKKMELAFSRNADVKTIIQRSPSLEPLLMPSLMSNAVKAEFHDEMDSIVSMDSLHRIARRARELADKEYIIRRKGKADIVCPSLAIFKRRQDVGDSEDPDEDEELNGSENKRSGGRKKSKKKKKNQGRGKNLKKKKTKATKAQPLALRADGSDDEDEDSHSDATVLEFSSSEENEEDAEASSEEGLPESQEEQEDPSSNARNLARAQVNDGSDDEDSEEEDEEDAY
eukprot:g4306.t1